MIAVKGLYRKGKIELLESPPEMKQSPVIVVFLEESPEEDILARYSDQLDALDWGMPMDEEGGKTLLALHEELAPYRAEANRIYDPEMED